MVSEQCRKVRLNCKDVFGRYGSSPVTAACSRWVNVGVDLARWGSCGLPLDLAQPDHAAARRRPSAQPHHRGGSTAALGQSAPMPPTSRRRVVAAAHAPPSGRRVVALREVEGRPAPCPPTPELSVARFGASLRPAAGEGVVVSVLALSR